MFKIGDIVRCRTHKYGITAYKRPCEVVGILSENKINVKCLGGDGSTFEVGASLFELVPKYEVLHKGMCVKDKYGEEYKFINYGVRGITVKHRLRDILGYDDIVYINKFIV